MLFNAIHCLSAKKLCKTVHLSLQVVDWFILFGKIFTLHLKFLIFKEKLHINCVY